MPWWNNHLFYKSYPVENFFLFPLLVPALIWSLVWKGLALYKAARNGQKWWFAFLLISNTLGILEIIYLLFFSNLPKKRNHEKRNYSSRN